MIKGLCELVVQAVDNLDDTIAVVRWAINIILLAFAVMVLLMGDLLLGIELLCIFLAVLLITDPPRLIRKFCCIPLRVSGAALSLSAWFSLCGVGSWQLQLVFIVLSAFALWVSCKVNEERLIVESVMQSDEVDKVLAHMGDNRPEFVPAMEWESYGCGETRALLHQLDCVEVPESEIKTTYKSVWLLAYLHGCDAMQRDNAAVRAALEKAQRQIAHNADAVHQARRQLDAYQKLQRSHAALVERHRELMIAHAGHRKREADLSQIVETLRAEVEAAAQPVAFDTKEERNTKIRAYVAAGHSRAEAAKLFGVSKALVVDLCRSLPGQEPDSGRSDVGQAADSAEGEAVRNDLLRAVI